MKQETTSTTARLTRKRRAAIGLRAALVLLLAVQGSLALAGEAVAAGVLGPVPLVATLQQETQAVISQGERLAANLRLMYDIQVLLADEKVEPKAVPSGERQTVDCNLSATGLGHSWFD